MSYFTNMNANPNLTIERSRQIANNEKDFKVLLMAALRIAPLEDLVKLRKAFPEIFAELIQGLTRYVNYADNGPADHEPK